MSRSSGASEISSMKTEKPGTVMVIAVIAGRLTEVEQFASAIRVNK